jgi:hypothetical protein
VTYRRPLTVYQSVSNYYFGGVKVSQVVIFYDSRN